MWPFKRKVASPKPIPSRLETWAINRVDVGTGTLMLLSQDANRVLRHCRIGRITAK